MHRTHHLAHDGETRISDQVEVRGDRADERVLDRQEAVLDLALEHHARYVAKLAARHRAGVGCGEKERFLAVRARLALKCYPLVRHRVRVMRGTACGQWVSGYIR